MKKLLVKGASLGAAVSIVLLNLSGSGDRATPAFQQGDNAGATQGDLLVPPPLARAGNLPSSGNTGRSIPVPAGRNKNPGKPALPSSTELNAWTAADWRMTILPTSSAERVEALWWLAERNRTQLYSVLWQTLEISDVDEPDFGDFVLASLDEKGDIAPGDVLASLVQDAPNPTLRRDALRLLAEASQEISVGPFIEALDYPDPIVRQFAREFFDELNAQGLFAAVTDAVRDNDVSMRLLALSTLEEMHQFAPVWEIADLLSSDPDPRIRRRALEMLTYGDRQSAIEQLTLALGDPNLATRELAAALLTELEQDTS